MGTPPCTRSLPARTAARPGRPRGSRDAARGKLSRRLSAKSPANTPGRAIRLKGRAAKAAPSRAARRAAAWSRPRAEPPARPPRGVAGGHRRDPHPMGLVAVGFLTFGGSLGGGARCVRQAHAGPAAVAQYPPARLVEAPTSAPIPATRPAASSSRSAPWRRRATRSSPWGRSPARKWIPRAQFLVSADGRQAQLAARARLPRPGGSAPSPADLPLLVAGGAAQPGGRGGGWLALGDGAAWTQLDGKTWTLAPGTGIAPLHAGDRVLALARPRPRLAVGEKVPGGGQAKATPVAWTSADGLQWRRLSAASLPPGHPSAAAVCCGSAGWPRTAPTWSSRARSPPRTAGGSTARSRCLTPSGAAATGAGAGRPRTRPRAAARPAGSTAWPW